MSWKYRSIFVAPLMDNGYLAPQILLWHLKLYSLTLGTGVACPRTTWVGGPVIDTDGPKSIAYVAGPPPIAGGTCLAND